MNNKQTPRHFNNLRLLYKIRDELEDRYVKGEPNPYWLETLSLSDVYHLIQKQEMKEWNL